jgi:hypothetical protein
MAGAPTNDSGVWRQALLAGLLAVVVVLGFAAYAHSVVFNRNQYVYTNDVPAIFGEVRALPTVVYQKPLSAFGVYSLRGGFNLTTDEFEKGVVALFPSMNNDSDPQASYAIFNLTLQYSTIGVTLVKPSANYTATLEYANTTLFGSICENYLVSPQNVYCGHLGDTPYIVYYQMVTLNGVNYYSYTVLAWSKTTIVVLHYESTMDVSVPQLQNMVNMLLDQDL